MHTEAVADAPTSIDVDRKTVTRVAWASFVGTFIEFYDYFIYGAAAALIFPKLFFSGLPPVTASIVSFATLGVTFITRPLGAVIFGHYGDTIGRKTMLVLSLMIMGVATFLIGLLPTYEMIGVWAPILLVTIRLLQGVAVGGEWGGATTMIIEYAPANRRGFYGTFVQLGNVFGLLTSTAAFAVASSLDEASFMSWGWRIPFLVSIVLLAVGMFIRLRIPEPPAFQRLKEKRKDTTMPLVTVFRNHPKEIFAAAGMRFSENVLGYLIISWILSYATTTLGISRQVALEGVMLAAASGIISFPLYGLLSDYIGRRAVFLFGALAACAYAFPFFWLLDTGSPELMKVALVIGYGVILASMYAIEPSYFSEMFATNVRYTGVSLGYQLASIVGGFTPMMAAGLLAWSGGASWPISLLLLAASAITALCVILVGETSQRTIVE
ncbi:MFS transporter [Skermanella stibiiresistens SB22]|uniref:MFS transporter n=1 Tax=Skermanella stibiiresistens SB22 TaxID=1385369 RepID=W9H9X9_9PROT|nr:MFS transporter [Skermanella stibiiresistens]EWY41561.1 MFS transporter [Skermanella stibiiresistens SB22]